MLEVKGLVTSYGMIEALKGVDLEAEEGRITCVLGPNGAGKTTLLMTIAGLLRPKRGSVMFEGRNIAGAGSTAVVRRGLALVPENRLVFPTMSVRDNLIAGAFTRLSRGRAEAMADLDRMFERFPVLKERAKLDAGTLSGGEQQMLAVARALMTRPRCLLMDEPSLGLAPMIVAEIFDLIRELNEDGVTILLVEQNARMALTVAHHFFLLDRGMVVFDGDPGAMAEDEVIQRAYLGSAGG